MPRTKSTESWLAMYKAVEAYIEEHHHLPSKDNHEYGKLLSWAKYNRKKINRGTLEDLKKELFLNLMATRSTEHTGGRKKKLV